LAEWPVLAQVTSTAWAGVFQASLPNQSQMEQDSYTVTNAHIAWESTDGKYSGQLFCQNITDELYANSSQAVHALEHLCFVGFGIAMWMALLGPLPKPAWFGNGARLVYVIVVRLGGAALANVLLWAGTPLYPDYAPGEAAHGISPLADQGAAGVLMTVEQGLVTMGLFVWLFFRAAQQSEERQELLDLAAERGVPLDAARAARAVAAGQGERLRERIAAGAAGSEG